MKSNSIKSINYTPGDPPDDPKQMKVFMREETRKLQSAILGLADGHLDPQPAAPSKPRAGDLRYADGVNWNPGGGEGVYRYSIAGAWVFLG